MKQTIKIMKYAFFDLLRSKWLFIYTIFFFAITDVLFRFGGSDSRVILSLMNVVLFIIPLVGIVFGLVYLYNSREFLELILSQPIGRKTLYSGVYIGLVTPLIMGFVAGVGVPFFIHGNASNLSGLLSLLASGVLLMLIFTALAFVIALRFPEKVKGFGLTLLTWLFLAVVYDGIILFVAIYFQDYPLEKPLIALSLLNPIDLARIILLLQTDFSALMGYTGAIFQKFFGSQLGIFIAILSLIIWTVTPFWLGMRRFVRKDF